MFEQMLRGYLSPIYDRLAELESSQESGARQGRNAIQLGTVAKVVDGRRVVMAIGKARTPAIKWFALWAGDVIEYRCPSVGEMALVLNYGSGDNNQSSIALVGIASDQFPFPVNDPNVVHQQIGPLASLTWSKDSGTLLVTAPGGTTFLTPTLDVPEGDVSDKVRTMAADRIIYNGHDHPHGDPTVGPVNQKQ